MSAITALGLLAAVLLVLGSWRLLSAGGGARPEPGGRLVRTLYSRSSGPGLASGHDDPKMVSLGGASGAHMERVPAGTGGGGLFARHNRADPPGSGAAGGGSEGGAEGANGHGPGSAQHHAILMDFAESGYGGTAAAAHLRGGASGDDSKVRTEGRPRARPCSASSCQLTARVAVGDGGRLRVLPPAAVQARPAAVAPGGAHCARRPLHRHQVSPAAGTPHSPAARISPAHAP